MSHTKNLNPSFTSSPVGGERREGEEAEILLLPLDDTDKSNNPRHDGSRKGEDDALDAAFQMLVWTTTTGHTTTTPKNQTQAASEATITPLKDDEEEEDDDNDTVKNEQVEQVVDYQATFQQFMLSGGKKNKKSKDRIAGSPPLITKKTTESQYYFTPNNTNNNSYYNNKNPATPRGGTPYRSEYPQRIIRNHNNIIHRDLDLALTAFFKRFVQDWLSTDDYLSLVVGSIADLRKRTAIASQYRQRQEQHITVERT
ncbi:hypothetical protein ACA910_018332 [Epithemia clementina (nom. ined.)]